MSWYKLIFDIRVRQILLDYKSRLSPRGGSGPHGQFDYDPHYDASAPTTDEKRGNQGYPCGNISQKFEAYTDFLGTLVLSFEDENNRPENVRKLEEDFYTLLLFIENEQTFHRLYDTILDSLKNDSREKIGMVLHALRKELGIHEEGKALHQMSFWHDIGLKMNAFADAIRIYRPSLLGSRFLRHQRP